MLIEKIKKKIENLPEDRKQETNKYLRIQAAIPHKSTKELKKDWEYMMENEKKYGPIIDDEKYLD